MPFINFDTADPMGRGYVKEAVNTDFILRGYYDASTNDTSIHITFDGEVSKFYKDSKAVDIYRHIQALPNFIEVPRDETGQAVELINLNYALHMFYRDKANSDDGESLLRIEYGMMKEIAQRKAFDPATHRAGGGLTSSGRSIVLRGDKADEVWSKYQGVEL